VKKVLGIDPGLTGALAWLGMDGRLSVVEDMPVIDGMVNGTMISRLVQAYDTEVAVVEKVHSMPKQGVASTFKFGMSYGVVLGVLAALEIPVYHMTSSEWKGYLHLSKDKAQSRRMAADRWPGHVDRFCLAKHGDRAEAALIALTWVEKHGRPRRIIRR
jgi:Holliday junction resolvasome RuvABC endonuclease subunit